MKRTISLILTGLLFVACLACSAVSETPSATNMEKPPEATPAPAGEPGEKEVTYPFSDSGGRVRHRLYINNTLVKTDHDPYTYPDEPKGAYYPLVEVLEYFGIECLFDSAQCAVKTKINGKIMTATADNKDIVVGNIILSGSAPEYIDDCFYVPSFVFMRLLDGVVDFNSDRSAVTLVTDIKIDKTQSGIAGLTITPGSSIDTPKYTGDEACRVCGGSGKGTCPGCTGQGRIISYVQVYDPISKTYKVQSKFNHCSACGGTGRRACTACGGTGKR